jgi:uncharacterized protein YcfL
MKSLKYCAFITIALVIVFSSAGCSSIHPTTHPASEASKRQLVNDSNPRATLILGSEDLLGKVAISDPRFKKVGQLTQAQVYMQNLTENRYTLEYKFDWEDSQGFAIQGINAWRRFTLTPQQRKTLLATGKNPSASNIVVTVRLPDDAFIENYKQMENE